jgi:hypothetical protein
LSWDQQGFEPTLDGNTCRGTSTRTNPSIRTDGFCTLSLDFVIQVNTVNGSSLDILIPSLDSMDPSVLDPSHDIAHFSQVA